MDINRFVQLVREATKASPEQHGVTSSELADALLIGKDAALVRLRKAVKAGAIRVEEGFRTSITGRIARVPVYVPAQGAGDERAVSTGPGAAEQA